MTHRPEWVIERACHNAEEIMNAGKASHYQEAVQWLQKARTAYLQSQRQPEWLSYRNQLVHKHARKRKLMELFKHGLSER